MAVEFPYCEGDEMNDPKIGEMYRCKKCGFEVQVTKGCNCKDSSTEMKCCGQSLVKDEAASPQNA